MAQIKLMNENLANKIAAGEIIERPLSVVKELVENAIDAEATMVEINLRESGINTIEVIDNGHGMNKADLMMCTKRHATSKIYSDKELFKIATLGFRGEALASIFAVSKFQITTSLDGETAYALIKSGDEQFEIEECTRNAGTTVEIKSLFYNTPARFKHLNSVYYELSLIINYVNKLALTLPEVSFKLVNDDNVIIHTFGNGDGLGAIAKVYSPKLANNMIKLEASSENFHLSGYTSHPNDTRSKKNYITLAINGRIIRNYQIENALINGYGKFLHTNQYPITILNIDLDYALVDVNIHPTKQQVKISLISELEALIEATVDQNLKSLMYIAHSDDGDINDTPLINNDANKVNDIPNENYYFNELPEQNENQITNDSLITDDVSIINPSKIEKINLFENEESKFTTPRLPQLEYIGSLQNTYLLFQNESGLYLLDQHAAQERINYELIFNKFKAKEFSFQQLLTPIIIELPANEFILVKEKLELLENLGIMISEFGPNTLKITEIDNFYLKAGNLKVDVEVIFDKIIKQKKLSFADLYEDVAIMMACKSSIKANQYLNNTDVDSLIKDLNQCEHPYTCPHGRPVIVNVTFKEIEKMFKRIFN